MQHKGHELSFFFLSPLITAKGKKDRQDANGNVETLCCKKVLSKTFAIVILTISLLIINCIFLYDYGEIPQ
ncbi:hypothetical protein Barb4_00420 [Bacteroidales bacterium Barb4]|nr:hypothetical protein Barb4_00420 [Bacteroidales bacterium Barb4]